MIAADNKERTVGIFYYICICDTISKTCRYLIQQWWAGFKSDADLTLQSPIFFYFNVENIKFLHHLAGTCLYFGVNCSFERITYVLW